MVHGLFRASGIVMNYRPHHDFLRRRAGHSVQIAWVISAEQRWVNSRKRRRRKAFKAIRDCRTSALGGHVEYVEQCDTCGHLAVSYNSCRNRHCPKCQAASRAKWLEDRQAE